MQMSFKCVADSSIPINLYYLVENSSNEPHILLINYFNVKIRI
jgi:hypothetical protein